MWHGCNWWKFNRYREGTHVVFGIVYTESKKKKKNKDKESKRQTASEQESSSLEVFTASGFDLEHIASLNVS
jgi:hypothetical protein